ncbi:MAG: outer membrane protein assembly factor BamD [Acidobacteriota bacterium]
MKLRTPRLKRLALLPLALLLVTVGCRANKQDPILRLSAQEALEIGKSYLDQEKYERARRHLVHAFEVEPNSRVGREALLLAADALYLRGGSESYITCEAKYRDFLNRFPTSDRADYAQFKVGACLAARAEKPDRDQRTTRLGIEAYAELLRLYPTSTYVPEAKQRIRELTDQLAAHELVVAVFYNRYGGRGICDAAIARLEGLQAEFPQFNRMDEALHQMVIAYGKCGKLEEATTALADLKRRFPDSEMISDAEGAWEEAAKEITERQTEAEQQAAGEEKSS